MAYKGSIEVEHELEQVMTPAEVEKEFGLAPGTVRKAVERGFRCRRPDERTILIHRYDAEMRWGDAAERERWQSHYDVFVTKFEMALKGKYQLTSEEDLKLLEAIREAEAKFEETYLLEDQLNLIGAWEPVRQRAAEWADQHSPYRTKAAG